MSFENRIEELLKLYHEDRGKPFPYSDAKKLRKHSGEAYEGLIPDLDLFSSEIAGYCSWGKGILKWSRDKVAEAQQTIGRSFFDRFPQYKPLEPLITQENVPDLYASLRLHEEVRVMLLDLFTQMSSGSTSAPQ